MSYIVQADLFSKISEKQLIQITDDTHLGIVDTGVVAAVISEAESEIDGFLAVRYATPIAAPVPQLVKTFAVDISIYKLYSRRQRVPESVKDAYNAAMRKLEQISKGIITLGVDPAPAESEKGSGGEVFGPERTFDRDKLESF